MLTRLQGDPEEATNGLMGLQEEKLIELGVLPAGRHMLLAKKCPVQDADRDKARSPHRGGKYLRAFETEGKPFRVRV